MPDSSAPGHRPVTRPHRFRRLQERDGRHRGRSRLHRPAHRTLRDHQGRDGLFRRHLRRIGGDGGAGQNHRPAPRRHPRGDAGGQRAMGRQAATRRRGDHERSLFRRHAPARYLHVLPRFRFAPVARLGRRDLSPHRYGRPGPRIERRRQHRDLPGRPAPAAVAALPRRRDGQDAGSRHRPERPRPRSRAGRPARAIRRLPGRRPRNHQARSPHQRFSRPMSPPCSTTPNA